MLSRVADSLYWMSRYLERAENTARLLDVHLNLVLELSPAAGQRRYGDILQALQVAYGEHAPSPADLTLDGSVHESISSCVAFARENARQIREQISSEMFEQLNRLYLYVRSRPTQDRFAIEPHSVFQKVKDGAHLFQGITDSTMTHGQGWQWIQAGRYLERADILAGLLLYQMQDFAQRAEMEGQYYSELLGLLKSFTAWEAYCKVYGAELTGMQVAEFLLLHSEFPHSLHFAIRQLATALDSLAQVTGMTAHAQLEPKIGRLLATLKYSSIEELATPSLEGFLLQVRADLSYSHDRLYQVYLSQTLAGAPGGAGEPLMEQRQTLAAG